MPRTESFYTDSESERVLCDAYLLELHKGKKTRIVTAALKEYHKNHRPDAYPPIQLTNRLAAAATLPTIRRKVVIEI